MTPGDAFVARMEVVERMVQAGTPMFAALAAGLEDEDWSLVYVATKRMTLDIKELSDRIRVNTTPLPNGDRG